MRANPAAARCWKAVRRTWRSSCGTMWIRSRRTRRPTKRPTPCGGIAVNRYHIISIFDILAQSFLEKLLGNAYVCCDKTKHRAHVRMDHSGSLAHAADCNCLAADLDFYGNFFLYGIRCHDCFGCFVSGFQSSLELRSHCLDTVGKFLDRKLHADNARRCDQYAVFIYVQSLCCCFCCCPAVAESLFSCTRIGDTAVADDHLCTWMFINDLLVPFDRSCLYDICGKSSCCHAWFLAVDHCHVSSSLIFDPCCCGCRLESFCRCNSTCNNLHNLYSSLVQKSPFLFTEALESDEVLLPRRIRTSGSCSVQPVLLHLLQGCRSRPS